MSNEGENSVSGPELPPLEALADALEQQQAAILARDPAGLSQVFDTLLALMAGLELGSAATGGSLPPAGAPRAGEWYALAASVQDRLRVNQALLRNGMSIADHLAAAIAAAPSIAAGGALFSEVG